MNRILTADVILTLTVAQAAIVDAALHAAGNGESFEDAELRELALSLGKEVFAQCAKQGVRL